MAKKYQKPDWLAASQCDGKHRFADAGLAKKVAHKSAQRKDNQVSAYRCSTCGGWHVGAGRTMKNLKDQRK